MAALSSDRTDPSAVAIIVAGGAGRRFGASRGKQLAEVAGQPLLSHAVSAFDRASSISFIVVVCDPARVQEYRLKAVEPYVTGTDFELVPGGAMRQDSVRNGLMAIAGDRSEEVVVVHDGARPLVSPDTIDAAVTRLLADGDIQGLVVGHPVYDTIKAVSGDRIAGTVDRDALWVAQTPQVFFRRALQNAHLEAFASARVATDDAALMEAAGHQVGVMLGLRENIKVTVAEDLMIADAVLRHRKKANEPA